MGSPIDLLDKAYEIKKTGDFDLSGYSLEDKELIKQYLSILRKQDQAFKVWYARAKYLEYKTALDKRNALLSQRLSTAEQFVVDRQKLIEQDTVGYYKQLESLFEIQQNLQDELTDKLTKEFKKQPVKTKGGDYYTKLSLGHIFTAKVEGVLGNASGGDRQKLHRLRERFGLIGTPENQLYTQFERNMRTLWKQKDLMVPDYAVEKYAKNINIRRKAIQTQTEHVGDLLSVSQLTSGIYLFSVLGDVLEELGQNLMNA